MIITINRGVVRTCIQVVRLLCGCDSIVINPQDVSIIMYRCGYGRLQCEQYFADVGCGDTIGPKKRYTRVPSPRIKYRGISLDDEGRVCFLWDDKLLNAEGGRWEGDLYYCDEYVHTLKFQIDTALAIGDSSCLAEEECGTSACEKNCD